MDAQLLVFVIAVMLLASTAQTVAGFGMALVAVPFLVTVLDVRDVVVVTSLLSLVNSSLIARSAWTHVPWRTVTTMLAGAYAGMPIGLAILLFAPADALRLGVGVTTIVMAGAMAFGLRYGARGTRIELLAGATAGVLGTSTSLNGPPVVLYLQDRNLPPAQFRGALGTFFVGAGVVSLTAYAITGVIESRSVALAAAALPAVFAGNVLGHALLGRLSDAVFRRVVLALLVVAAGAAVVSALIRIVH